jgi:hypothetical protein
MGQHVHVRQRLDELCCVVTLVCTQCDLGLLISNLLGIGNHYFGGFAFGIAICGCDQSAGNQAMAVVAQGVADEAQLTGLIALAVKPCIGVGGGLVGFVAALLAFEVARVFVGARRMNTLDRGDYVDSLADLAACYCAIVSIDELPHSETFKLNEGGCNRF